MAWGLIKKLKIPLWLFLIVVSLACVQCAMLSIAKGNNDRLGREVSTLSAMVTAKDREIEQISQQTPVIDQICKEQSQARAEVRYIVQRPPACEAATQDETREVISYEAGSELIDFVNTYLSDSVR